jgi:two-component system cell cycle response regulator DivK
LTGDLSAWNVAVIDDEPDGLFILSEFLRMDGATVSAFASGQMALEALPQILPNLIITDLTMPVMDGYELLRRIRQIAVLGDTPVIALTAHSMFGDRAQISAAGFDGYIRKPLRVETIVAEIVACVPALKP